MRELFAAAAGTGGGCPGEPLGWIDMWDVVVAGAGAAGLLAAIRAAERGRRTLLVEKNARPGVKILMSGGTRCNLTHNTDPRGIVDAFGPQGRFLYRALSALDVRATVALFEAEGVPTKVEPNGKVFPASDRASDVLDALLRRLGRSGAVLELQSPLVGWERQSDQFVLRLPDRVERAASVILTTGGLSYPSSGTTGDGYSLTRQMGHRIVEPRPALTPIQVAAPWVAGLRGLRVDDAVARVREPGPDPATAPGRVLAERRESVLLAHFGLTGPAVLDVSRAVGRSDQPERLVLELDLVPGLTEEELDGALRVSQRARGARHIVSHLPGELPHRLAAQLCALAGVEPSARAAELSREARTRLVRLIKQLELPVTGTVGFRKAEVTSGGVPLDEVDAYTMRSRLCPGLFLAGEVLDLDGPIGGYNFQAAFSTGWLAGSSV